MTVNLCRADGRMPDFVGLGTGSRTGRFGEDPTLGKSEHISQ